MEPRPDRVRYVTALKPTGKTITGIADEAGLSRHYIYQVLRGHCSLSARVRDVLRRAVGPAGWAYALGESNELPTPTSRTAG